jgi:hypothetical protein
MCMLLSKWPWPPPQFLIKLVKFLAPSVTPSKLRAFITSSPEVTLKYQTRLSWPHVLA